MIEEKNEKKQEPVSAVEAARIMCRRCINNEVCGGSGCVPMSILMEAAELHDPKKPQTRNRCSTCGESLTGSALYCRFCGQRIDWSNW